MSVLKHSSLNPLKTSVIVPHGEFGREISRNSLERQVFVIHEGCIRYGKTSVIHNFPEHNLSLHFDLGE